MQMKKFLKENISFVVLFAMLMIACSISMMACNAKVNPSSPGIATVTQTPIAPTSTPNISLTPLAAGSIEIIGWARNGSGQFGFIPTTIRAFPSLRSKSKWKPSSPSNWERLSLRVLPFMWVTPPMPAIQQISR
jgi:hypothetical protein